MTTRGQFQIEEFGRDHWSLLAYIETRVVSYPVGQGGSIDHRHLRCNPARHPHLDVNGGQWRPEYSTRLKVGSAADHDDYDCLGDLEAAGLVWGLTGLYQSCGLTDEGERIAAALRLHKSAGHNYADFAPPPLPVRGEE